MPTTPGFVSSQWKMKRAVAVSTSPFTGKSQVQEYDYALWQAVLTLPPMKRELSSQWQAFFMKLRGLFGTFLMGDPDGKSIRGSATGSVTLYGAISTGSTQITVTTSTINQTNAFRTGDYIQLGTSGNARLHMVTGDTTTDGNARAILDIEPAIKSDYADGATVIISDCKTVWRMDDNSLGWDADHVSKYGISFSCTEAL